MKCIFMSVKQKVCATSCVSHTQKCVSCKDQIPTVAPNCCTATGQVPQTVMLFPRHEPTERPSLLSD